MFGRRAGSLKTNTRYEHPHTDEEQTTNSGNAVERNESASRVLRERNGNIDRPQTSPFEFKKLLGSERRHSKRRKDKQSTQKAGSQQSTNSGSIDHNQIENVLNNCEDVSLHTKAPSSPILMSACNWNCETMPSPCYDSPWLPMSNSSRNHMDCNLNGASIFDLYSIAEDSPQEKLRTSDDDVVKSVDLLLMCAGLNTPGKHPEITTSEILRLCGQDSVCEFDHVFPKRLSSLSTSKVGEGAYSEVYKVMIGGSKVVVKIIPVGGVTPTTEEKQMSLENVVSEMAITKTMSELRENQIHSCASFIHLKQMHFVKGNYPKALLSAWKRYARECPTDNQYPGVLLEDQLYVILQFENGGSDLDHFPICDPVKALSIFVQVSYALAVAEKALSFEHRDLHSGNILVSKTKCPTVTYYIDGAEFRVKTSGVLVKIIDFTLSRVQQNNGTVFTDLVDHEELFNGQGDPQYDVYREMRKVNKNNWAGFCPLTNVLWLSHILEKMTNWTKSRSKNEAKALAYDKLCRAATFLKSCSSAREYVINTELS